MGYRQSASMGASGSSTTVVSPALGSAVLAGSRLVAYIVWGASTGSIAAGGVSDSVNGATGWVKVTNSNASESTGPTQGEWWTNPNSAAGSSLVVTATFAAGASFGFRAIAVHEVTGTDPSEGAAALASARSQTSVTNFTTANITPTVNGCYIVGGCSNDVDATAPTAGGSFNLREVTTTQVTGTEDQIQSVAAAIAASFNFSAAKTGVVNVVAFKPAPATGATTWPVGTRRAGGQKGPFDALGFLLSPFRTYDYAPAASQAQTFAYTGSGGLQSGGTAPVQVLFIPPPSGGLQSGGHAPLIFVAIPKPSGGLQSGGHAPSNFTKVYVPTGGLQSGGSSHVQFIAVYAPHGGLQSGGHAPIAIIAVVRPTGGLQSGGTAPRFFVAFPATSGGLNAGGAAFTAFVPAGGVSGVLQMISALQRLGDST